MARATMTSGGRVTIPKEIRDGADLKPGDKLEFFYDDRGGLILRRASLRVDEVAGCLHRPGMRARTIEEMDEGIAQYMREKHGIHARQE